MTKLRTVAQAESGHNSESHCPSVFIRWAGSKQKINKFYLHSDRADFDGGHPQSARCDHMLSIIVSKALLEVDDDKMKDAMSWAPAVSPELPSPVLKKRAGLRRLDPSHQKKG
jgi:hypothetical protein